MIQAVQEKDSDFFEYEDYEAPDKPIGKLEFLRGCSWYCGGSVKKITSSSELKQNKGINYSGKNAHDFNEKTAWIEGSQDYGIGEYLEYEFKFNENEKYSGNLGINKIIIANGYKKDKLTWKNNSRIKLLKVYINNKPSFEINLLDSYEIQTVDIDLIMFLKKSPIKLKFEILDIYKGDKYKDTALSLLMFEGVGVH